APISRSPEPLIEASKLSASARSIRMSPEPLIEAPSSAGTVTWTVTSPMPRLVRNHPSRRVPMRSVPFSTRTSSSSSASRGPADPDVDIARSGERDRAERADLEAALGPRAVGGPFAAVARGAALAGRTGAGQDEGGNDKEHHAHLNLHAVL